MNRRLILALLGALLWLAAITFRLWQLQVDRHQELRERAQAQQQRVIQLDPPRGTIYDARGRELAVSIQVESAFAVPREVADPEATAAALARLLHVDGRQLVRQLRSDREFVWVARKLDPPVARRLRALGLPGIYFLPENRRYYPMRELAAQVLGYVGTDNHGLAGVELAYDGVISGKPGRRTVLRDARSGTVMAPDLAAAEAEPGRDIQLTLDASIQYIAERELARAVKELGASKGSVVILDPGSGAVLAMASYPGFDPNRFSDFPPAWWRNAPVMDAYEPGSTFKMITAAAALEANVLDPKDLIDCEMGGITLANTRIGDHKPFGLLSFREVIARSSNVGAVKLGLLVGPQHLYRTIRAFGFGEPTGVDLPGEHAGLLRPRERWHPLTHAYLSFGQGISVTPLQLANAFAAVGNGGTLYRPYLVAAVGSGGRGGRLARSPVVLGQSVSPATVRKLVGMLEQVVMDGTGKGAAISGYPVAGKTGTAQKVIRGRYAADRHMASFVGFVPARNPRIVCLVVLDEPRGLIHGGSAAAPVFRAIASQTLLYLGVGPEREPLAAWPGERRAPDLAAQARRRRNDPADSEGNRFGRTEGERGRSGGDAG